MKSLIFLAPALASALLITACDRAENLAPTPLNACSIQLFSSENFETTTPSDVIVGPGKFSTLKNLPGAKLKDWSGKVKSIKVERVAGIAIWPKENFQGTTHIYDRGISEENISDVGSLQIVCTGSGLSW